MPNRDLTFNIKANPDNAIKGIKSVTREITALESGIAASSRSQVSAGQVMKNYAAFAASANSGVGRITAGYKSAGSAALLMARDTERSFGQSKRSMAGFIAFERESQTKRRSAFLASLREEETAEAASLRRRRALMGSGRAADFPASRPTLGNRAAGALTTAASSAVAALPIAGAVAALQFTAAEANKATKLASDLNESIDKAQRIFGNTEGNGIIKWAEGAADSMGLAKTQAIEATGVFGNLFRAAGVTGSESADLSKQLVKLAVDMGSFSNADPSQVLENLQSGLNGEGEPLRKFGVFIDEARVKAEAFADGIAKPVKNAAAISQAHKSVEIAVSKLATAQKKYGDGSVEVASAQLALDKANGRLEKALQGSGKELTNQEKILARLKIILHDTAIQQGNFRDTANGAANAEKILNARLQDLETKLGGKLLPLRVGFIAFLNDMVETGGKAVDVAGGLASRLERIANINPGTIKNIMDALAFGASGGLQRAGINAADRALKEADAEDQRRITPGYKADRAKRSLMTLDAFEQSGQRYLPPEVNKHLRDVYGVDTDRRNLTGQVDTFAVLREARQRIGAVLQKSEQAFTSQLDRRMKDAMHKGEIITPAVLNKRNMVPVKGNGMGNLPKPPGFQEPGGTPLYSGSERNREDKAEETAAQKAKKAAEALAFRRRMSALSANVQYQENAAKFQGNLLGSSLGSLEEGGSGGNIGPITKTYAEAVREAALDAAKAIYQAEIRKAYAEFDKAKAQAAKDNNPEALEDARLTLQGLIGKGAAGKGGTLAQENADRLKEIDSRVNKAITEAGQKTVAASEETARVASERAAANRDSFANWLKRDAQEAEYAMGWANTLESRAIYAGRVLENEEKIAQIEYQSALLRAKSTADVDAAIENVKNARLTLEQKRLQFTADFARQAEQEADDQRNRLISSAEAAGRKELYGSAYFGRRRIAQAMDTYQVAYDNAPTVDKPAILSGQARDVASVAGQPGSSVSLKKAIEIEESLREKALSAGNYQLAKEIEDIIKDLKKTTNVFAQEMKGTFQEAGQRGGEAFLLAMFESRGNRGGLETAMKGIAADMGRNLAGNVTRELGAEFSRPSNIFGSAGRRLAKDIEGGGIGAAKAIGTAAAYLQSVSILSGAQGKKKQGKGILGGLLGLAVGSLIPGGNLVTDFAIGSVFGGSFAKGGTAKRGRIATFGEQGIEFGIPEQDMRIFTHEQSANMVKVLKGEGAGGGNSGSPSRVTNNHFYIDKVENKADVDRVKQIMDDERQREAFV